MEMVFSPSSAYLIVREVYRSYKCRVLIGQDNYKNIYSLNQLRDKRMIAKYLNTFDKEFPDFVESFVYDGNYFIVFKYHNGTGLDETRAAEPAAALDTCESICFAALAADIPADFFCQLVTPDCIALHDGEINFNKFFTFLEEDCGSDYSAQKLAWELSGYIQEAEFDPVQMKTLEKLMKRLEEPFHSLLELYLFVRDFRKAYKPMETTGVLKGWWEALMMFTGEIMQKVLFYAAIASALLASLFILWNAFAPPDESDMLIKQVGGYMLSERGSINESDFGKTD